MKKAPPWLLLLAGLTVGYPAARLAVAPAKPASESQPASPPKAETPPPCPGPRCEPLRVIGEFFGLAPDAVDPATLAAEAGDRGYDDLRFLVALVPMPPDPRLDHALDAMQRGFAQSGWLVDRVWLPWAGKGAKGEPAAQNAPGLVLFRRQWADGTRALALVFVVGETPKAGIQKDAFREALSLIADFQTSEAPEDIALVKILGPSFSGSAESLRVALTSWREERAEGGQALRFQAASGSATASGLDATFKEMGVDFCRTVVPDSLLQRVALPFLWEKMGWDSSRVALLTESDTAYGSSLIQAEGGGPQAEKSLIVVPFPSHISELRVATQAEKEKAEKDAAGTPIPTSRRLLLGLDLTESDRPPDLVPTFSQDTLRSNELMLQNLLETLAREGVRAVGIIATDPKDKLFLAEKVREVAPDTVLFTFDNDLLFAHPQYARTLDGMLVFTSAPLFTEGAPWLAGSLRGEARRQRRQLTSELQQGDYEAIRYLLGDSNVSQPRAWIVAVGNGSLWPVARLDLPKRGLGETRLCGNPVDSDQPEEEGNGFAGKDDLQVLLVALLLVALGYRLRRAALLTPVAGSSLDPSPGSRRLLVLGSILLALAAGTLLVMGSVPLWARYLSLGQLPVRWETAQVLYLLGLAAVYAVLVANAARAAHDRVTRLRGLAWGLLGIVALVSLAAILWWLCMPGGQVEFFHLRARAFSSGLSPLVSLAAVGGAVYAWILWELKRRRLIARQSTDCPVENLGDPAVAGVDPILKAVRALLIRTFPEDWRFWFLPALAFLPPVVLLWATVQPVGEARGYGRLFILFLTLALSLGALSFFRFFLLWRWTSRILRRLDNSAAEVAEAFKAVAKDLEWRPIQSFSWQLPPFKTPTVSVRRLRELAAAGKVVIPGGPESLEERLREVFVHERDNGSPEEIAARNKLEEVFRQACIDLRNHGREPEVLQFLALRVAAWLRYVFAHMRCCLIGGLLCGLLSLVGVTAYVFQPKQFVSLAITLALAGAVGLTLFVFLQMDRNATLSRIGDTTPGKVSFDRAFWTKIFTYVGIPAFGLIASRFPEVGTLLGRLADQVLRVTGGG